MSSRRIGLACLLLFGLAQAVRDAFFGNVFQSVSFFVVAILAFGISTIVFGTWAWQSSPREVRALVRAKSLFLAVNATTAAAWMAYFFSLRHLEPAIVNTLYTGIGPITVLACSAFGMSIAERTTTGWLERAGYLGVITSLIAIAFVVVYDRSGLAGQPLSTRIAAVLLAATGGVIIAISHMIARHLGDMGIGSNVVMGLRFVFAFGIAMLGEVALGQPRMRPEFDALPGLAIAAFGLIVIPSYFLQLGVARTSPLAVNVMRSLGPAFVFGVQQLDERVRFSGATFGCIVAFVCFAILTSTLRVFAEARH